MSARSPCDNPGPAAKEAQLATRAAEKDPTLRRFLHEAVPLLEDVGGPVGS